MNYKQGSVSFNNQKVAPSTHVEWKINMNMTYLDELGSTVVD